MSSKVEQLNTVPQKEVYHLPGGAATEKQHLQGPDSRGRSIAKALSWRVTALIITVSIVWVMTGEAVFAAGVGAADALFKIVLYYLHERAWNRSSFGHRGH